MLHLFMFRSSLNSEKKLTVVKQCRSTYPQDQMKVVCKNKEKKTNTESSHLLQLY